MHSVTSAILAGTVLVAARPSLLENFNRDSVVRARSLSLQAHRRATNASICDGNTADDRSTWCDYDTGTNYYETWPDTGVTREYWFELMNTTMAPDGVDRVVLSVNGSVPGPTIEANWGDTVKVHVINNLAANGTSIHFHGIRQYLSNANDGVISITQCPTAPGNTVTYQWQATQYGSSWYHSHYALQAWEGVFGGIVIHGPSTGNYDEDLGSLFLNDWSHETFSALYTSAETNGPPTLDNGLINGTNTYEDGGSRFETTFQPGISYLLRIVNGAIDTHFDFSIDNHTLTVIASDFVPIVPYETNSISVGMGQRYDVIVTADQSDVASDFWMRAVPDSFCSDNNNSDDIKGIVHYGDSTSTPSTSAYTIIESDCSGENSSSIVPYLSLTASSSGSVSNDDAVTVKTNSDGVFKWYIGSTSFLVDWQEPTALEVINNSTTFDASNAVIELPTADEWMVLVIETTLAVPHPIHLHGHDFFQLASGTGTYADVSPTLQTDNPPRRDVAMLPAAGYLVIAFSADNPGTWLAHCHIGWHTEEGFALQFVERYDEIGALYNATELQSACDIWDEYQSSAGLLQDDSGV